MTNSCAALRAYDQGERSGRIDDDAARARCRAAKQTCQTILRSMIADAATTLQPQAGYPEVEADSAIPFRFRLNGLKDPLDPRTASDPEARADPDDALLKLTTAAEVAQAVDDREHTPDIVELVR